MSWVTLSAVLASALLLASAGAVLSGAAFLIHVLASVLAENFPEEVPGPEEEVAAALAREAQREGRSSWPSGDDPVVTADWSRVARKYVVCTRRRVRFVPEYRLERELALVLHDVGRGAPDKLGESART